MKLFRKDSDYAVRTLIFLALRPKGDVVSSTVVSQESSIPLNFLRRVVSKLIKAKYLSATEGVRGGVALIRDASTITVGEIMELFQGPLEMSDCKTRKKPCPNRCNCPLRRRILGIERLVADEFQKITIQTLIDDSYLSPLPRGEG